MDHLVIADEGCSTRLGDRFNISNVVKMPVREEYVIGVK